MVEKTIFGNNGRWQRGQSLYIDESEWRFLHPFLDLGAIWSTMLVPDRNGEMADVLLGHETVADCLVKRWTSGRGCWTKCKPDWRRDVYVK